MRNAIPFALMIALAVALATYDDQRGFAALMPAKAQEPTFSLILPAPTPQEPDRLDVADWNLTALDCVTAAAELDGARCEPEPRALAR
ncbi:hypothetical protein GURKE_04530 [Brevundimonas phage vB_BpoS-Gurke]|uniref:Uncharacterized protein n=1 Tax=Brevundimonas phage vB_BpoS-Gurke TaxID=2948599 RepID=A0A9E7N3Q3_9CAUD|nr:hypothetical protein GURKE_04530 [Brevundimonas phage vB_BpoS-Gurke]